MKVQLDGVPGRLKYVAGRLAESYAGLTLKLLFVGWNSSSLEFQFAGKKHAVCVSYRGEVEGASIYNIEFNGKDCGSYHAVDSSPITLTDQVLVVIATELQKGGSGVVMTSLG